MKGLMRWVVRFVVLTLVALALAVAGLMLTSNGPDVRGPFEGRIVDAETGAPIEGAHVVVAWTRLINYEAGRDEVDAREAVTDTQGRWQIPERPTPLWEGGPVGLRRRFYVFAPSYAVADPSGTPRDQYAGRESNVTTMRRLATHEERCRTVPFVASSMSITASRKSPRFHEALLRERSAIGC